MSEHDWVQENLDAYVAGALPAADLNRVAQHVAECADCKQALTRAQKLETTMAELFADARPDATLEDRMIHGLRKPRAPMRWPAWARFAIGAAAVVMLGVVGAVVQAVAGGVDRGGGFDVVAFKTPRSLATTYYHRDGEQGRTYFGSLLHGSVHHGTNIVDADNVDGKRREGFSVVDVDPAATEFDTDIKYKNERISDVSVPGARNADKGRVAKDMLDIPEGHQAVGLPVNLATTAHGVAALPGSRVNLIVTERDKQSGSTSSRVLLKNVQVLAADARVNREADGTAPQVVTLALSPKDALKASLAKESGILSLSLRKLNDTSTSEGIVVSGNDILEGRGRLKKVRESAYDQDKAEDRLKDVKEGKIAEKIVEYDKEIFNTEQAHIWSDQALQAKLMTKKGFYNPDTFARGETPGYFKPGDGPPLPGDGQGESPDGGGPPKGTIPRKELEGIIKKLETKKIDPADLTNITAQPPGKTDPPPGADNTLKIIRTGEMEFEVDSFDNAVKAVVALLKPLQTKGAFKLKEDSNKQANGKTRGQVVVRMPPQLLDEFVLDLRRDLGKVGELKMQHIGSQDVTKQFTDTESELKAARTVEERLLAIIKNGKGDVKDLVAAEKELGTWRTKIEKMEGEIRYYANQVALSTLTINLVEKEITAAAALVVNATVKMRIEVDNVSKAREAAEKAVEEFKGRIVKSDEKQYPAGQVEAIVHAEIPPANKEAFHKALEKLGIVSGNEDTQTQTTEGGAGPVLTPRRRVNDVLFQVALNNIVNVRPKLSVKLEVVSTDVRSNFEKLKDEIIRVNKGQIRDAKLDESQDRQKSIATIDFSVPTDKKPDIDKLIASFGPTLDRVNTQAPLTEISTEQKFGYQLTLFSIATVEPREKVRLEVAVKDVERKSAEIAELVKEAKGTLARPKSGLNKQGKTEAILVINVPLTLSDRLVRDIKATGEVIDWAQAPNPAVPENDLATAQIVVDLVGPNPIIPRDEGVGSYATKSLYLSFTIFVNCVLVILAGIAFILPWAVVILIGIWVVRRMSRKAVPVQAVVAAPIDPAKP